MIQVLTAMAQRPERLLGPLGQHSMKMSPAPHQGLSTSALSQAATCAEGPHHVSCTPLPEHSIHWHTSCACTPCSLASSLLSARFSWRSSAAVFSIGSPAAGLFAFRGAHLCISGQAVSCTGQGPDHWHFADCYKCPFAPQIFLKSVRCTVGTVAPRIRHKRASGWHPEPDVTGEWSAVLRARPCAAQAPDAGANLQKILGTVIAGRITKICCQRQI